MRCQPSRGELVHNSGLSTPLRGAHGAVVALFGCGVVRRCDVRYALCMSRIDRPHTTLPEEERLRELRRGASVLRGGACIVMPTESVYGVFVRADDAGARLLTGLTKPANFVHTPLFTLHLADLGWIMPMLEVESAVTRRLIHKLSPSPVRMVLHQPEHALERIRKKLGVSAGIIDLRGMIAFRIPDHPIAREVIRESGHPTLARGVGVSVWGGQGGADLVHSTVFDDTDGPGCVIYDGPARYGRTSSTINLWPDGRFKIGQEAAVDEGFIMDKLKTRVLFVCTGNTCRSPMAEGLARGWEQDRTPNGLTIEASSAGVAASNGSPASPQTVETLRERGIDLSNHRSRMITPEMVGEADLVLTMTPSHAQAVMQTVPDSAHKVFPIDPLSPIRDPIGQPIEAYRAVAGQLEPLIDARLKELIDE